MLKILVFLHGTTITEEDEVDLPILNAARKVQAWKAQGAEIVYLTHRRGLEDVKNEEAMLAKHGFPAGPVPFRGTGEQYNDVAERIIPDIIVEDDCASIGGEKEMTYPRIRPSLKIRIKSIVVREGLGIDHLPDEIVKLENHSVTRQP